MAKFTSTLRDSWTMFSAEEKKNILLYILGIMLYKFGLEAFNGSFIALATNRYDYDAVKYGIPKTTFFSVGLLTGLNQAFQVVGSILIAPLIKRWPTKLVLSLAIVVFAIMSAILLIVDAATGGYIKPTNWDATHKTDDFGYYGTYNTNGMIPIYCVSGIAYGMVELIRRVIPRDIVGGNVQKLRRMDSLVHIFYEISGTAAAFVTALALIPRFGNNMSFIITPILFVCAGIVWFFISNLNYARAAPLEKKQKTNYFTAIGLAFWRFIESVWVGGRIIFTSRKFCWLPAGYSVALYGHRYLENGLAPIIARRYLGQSAWSQIMVGGSNLGELLGALFVFLFTNFIQTPMPWLRLDSLMLLIVWYLPYWYPQRNNVTEAWRVAGTFIPISFGWAAGDVSLAAYIQASLSRIESNTPHVSALGAVMAFLYSTYIIMYAICSPLLGGYVDSVDRANNGNVRPALVNLAGVQFTLLMAVIMASTFVPRGSLSFNPKMLSDEALDKDVDASSNEDLSDAKYSVDTSIDETNGNRHQYDSPRV